MLRSPWRYDSRSPQSWMSAMEWAWARSGMFTTPPRYERGVGCHAIINIIWSICATVWLFLPSPHYTSARHCGFWLRWKSVGYSQHTNFLSMVLCEASPECITSRHDCVHCRHLTFALSCESSTAPFSLKEKGLHSKLHALLLPQHKQSAAFAALLEKWKVVQWL